MNILKLMPFIILIFYAFNTSATQYKFVAGDDSFATKMCIYAGSDNKSRLRRAKEFSFDTPRSIANTIQCNDMTIARFAKKYHAMNTFKYLNRLTRVSLREYDTKVEIKDVTAATSTSSDDVQVIYVRSAK